MQNQFLWTLDLPNNWLVQGVWRWTHSYILGWFPIRTLDSPWVPSCLQLHSKPHVFLCVMVSLSYSPHTGGLRAPELGFFLSPLSLQMPSAKDRLWCALKLFFKVYKNNELHARASIIMTAYIHWALSICQTPWSAPCVHDLLILTAICWIRSCYPFYSWRNWSRKV